MSFIVALVEPVEPVNPGSGCRRCLATAMPTGICPLAKVHGEDEYLLLVTD